MTDRRSRSSAPAERYAVERTLGRGGMATVYLARDQALDRPVALKVLAEHLADDEAFRDRFLREARLAAKFVHPNVVQVYDVGEDERGPFIVMEYVAVDTLADELRRRGKLPSAEVVTIGIQLCAALEAAHAAGLVHRDIKPQNILRRPDGQVKIADFGIARSLTATRHTEQGTVLGTAAYLAPEQARGEPVTGAADIYSLGVVLYELLTGQTPFSAGTLPELLLKREQGIVTPPRELAPDTPVELEAVVMRCLSLQPEYRPASAATLAHDLAASINEPVTEPLPDPTGTRATEVLPATALATPLSRDRSRAGTMLAGAQRWRLLVSLAAAACLLALSLVFAVFDSGARQQPNRAARRPATTIAPPTTTAPATPTNASNTQQPPAPTTPDEAIADVRAAIAQAENAGQIDPSAADDLNRRLDDISKGLQHPNPNDAAHKLADLQRRLSDLNRAGRLTSAGLAQIGATANQLATLLPQPPRPPGQGDEDQ